MPPHPGPSPQNRSSSSSSSRSRSRSRSSSEHAAHAVSAVLSPAWLGALCLVLAGGRQDGLSGALWGLAVAALVLGAPMMVLARRARRGRYADRFVPERRDRHAIYAAVGCLLLAVLALLWFAGPGLGAPRAVALALAALLTGLLALIPITVVWKVSAHAGVAGAAAVILPALVSPWAGLGTWLLPVLVGWARVRLGAHTTAQVVVGALIGASVGAVFAALLPRVL